MSINERIRLILDRLKMQDQELAKKIGMPKATFSQRMSKENWTIEELKDLSEVTGYSFSWICEESGPELEKDHFAAIEEWQAKHNVIVAEEPKGKYTVTIPTPEQKEINTLKNEIKYLLEEIAAARREQIIAMKEKEKCKDELNELKKILPVGVGAKLKK